MLAIKEKLVKTFIKSLNEVDFKQLESLMHKDIVAHVTIADGGTKKLASSKDYINALKAMRLKEVNFRLDVTQLVEIEEDKVMIMVEVQAEKPTKKLHNFAAHLLQLKNGKIIEMWMVEVLPKYSEEFWLN